MLGGRESMTWKVTFYDDDHHDGCDGDGWSMVNGQRSLILFSGDIG